MKKLWLGALCAFCLLGLYTGSAFAVDPYPESDFVSIFNGKDLTGWTGDKSLWSVEDGAIVGKTTAEKPLTYNQSLAWKDKVEDFVLRFEFWISNPGNSGMYYRGWYLKQPFQMGGYQADFDGAATFSGIVYGEALRGILAKRGTVSFITNDHKPVAIDQFAPADELKKNIKIEDWNLYQVYACDGVFIHKINGKIMSILVDEDKEIKREEGMLGIQLHVGPPMTVKVRNIRLKKLDD
ncbi:MAG: DUF1080 domain-containing protein [Planctomycetia bacterium]|nr:DUF1080 domain-containing protein [Planctomycetia bacterium]